MIVGFAHEGELQERNHDYRSLQAKLRTAESEELSKSTALNSTQEQLAAITEQHSQTTNHLLEVEVNEPSKAFHSSGSLTVTDSDYFLLG